MQERQLSTIWAFLLGLCWPGASLLCVGKAKHALLIGFLLVFYAFFLAFMPVRFIILTLYLYIIVHAIALLYGLTIGLLEARKPKKKSWCRIWLQKCFSFLFSCSQQFF